LDHRPQRMSVEGVAVQCLGMEHELAALGPSCGCGDRHLAAELLGRMRLAFANAFDLGRVQRIDLGAALAVVLMPYFDGKIEEVGKARLELGPARDLPADVTDETTQADAQVTIRRKPESQIARKPAAQRRFPANSITSVRQLLRTNQPDRHSSRATTNVRQRCRRKYEC